MGDLFAVISAEVQKRAFKCKINYFLIIKTTLLKTNLDFNSINLLHNGKYLMKEDEGKSLSTLQFIENDLVLLQMKPKASNIKSSDFEIM